MPQNQEASQASHISESIPVQDFQLFVAALVWHVRAAWKAQPAFMYSYKDKKSKGVQLTQLHLCFVLRNMLLTVDIAVMRKEIVLLEILTRRSRKNTGSSRSKQLLMID